MAWALQFDGVNDYATLAAPIENSGAFTYVIRFKLSTVAIDSMIMGSSTSTGNWVGWFNGNFTVRLAGGSFNLPSDPIADTWYTLTIDRTALNAVSISEPLLGSISGSRAGNVTIDQFGRYFTSSSLILSGQIEYITLTSPESNNNWDAAASSHAAGTPILIDTIGGNDATGVNMPTDGSAWIDLGGSGVTVTPDTLNSLSISLNPAIAFNSALSLTPLTVNSNSISLNPLITFTASLELTPSTINSSSISLDPVIQFGGVLDLAPNVLNTSSVALNPTIEFTSSLVVSPQTLNSASISIDPLIEFKAVINLTPDTLNTSSISLNPTITTGAVQSIGTVTAGFADDLYSVKYKPSGITVNFKE